MRQDRTQGSVRRLEDALLMLCEDDLRIGCRRIQNGEEAALLPDERSALEASRVERRRASASARVLARQSLESLGAPPAPIGKAPSGAPIWPDGFVGSLAHDETYAVAVVGRSQGFKTVGVDVEPAEPLPEELWDVIATPAERARHRKDGLAGRTLFSAKEAIYKAFFALDGTVLDYADIETRLDAGHARIRDGRLIALRHALCDHIATFAFIRRSPSLTPKHAAKEFTIVQ